MPGVTDTKSFYLRENPIPPLTLKVIAKTATNFQIQVTGPIGPDYILQATAVLNNMNGWTNRLTNTPLASPMTITDPNITGFTNLFYRVQLSP